MCCQRKFGRFLDALSLCHVSFQQTPNPRNYLSRREQWRLLLLVATLGLVVFLITEAGDLAKKFFGSEKDLPAASPPARVTDVDNRLKPPQEQEDEIPGTFTSPAGVKDDAPVDTTGRYFPGVKPAYLKKIRDNTRSRKEEHKALLNLLDILNKTDEETLERESKGRATYAQLSLQSDAYRGELVTVRGRIRRTELLRSIPKNDWGITQYYRTVVWPADKPSSPMLVYCLHLPQGFPHGMKIDEQTEITGFYFKRELYLSETDEKKQLRTAPILLAKTVRWHKRSPRKSIDILTIVLVVAVAAVASAVVVVYVYLRTRTVRPAEPDTPPNLTLLRDADIASYAGPPPENLDNREQEE